MMVKPQTQHSCNWTPETAPIASRAVPTWMLPDYYVLSRRELFGNRWKPQNPRWSIKNMITEALDDLTKDKADDPNRLNYTINAVEAIVDNRTKKLEAELAATRKNLEAKIDKLTDMVQKLLDDKEQS